jgi:hypothetical protein
VTESFTLIEDGRSIAIEATLAGEGVRLAGAQVEAALGWKWRPEGLCRGGVCIPVRDVAALGVPEALDLTELARLLGRPLALDVPERAAALAEAPSARGAALTSLEAPDFSLPDLEGRMHRLSDHRGKKVLLVAYASW